MKKIITLAFMLTVSVAAFAQQTKPSKLSTNQNAASKKDTVFTVQLNKQALQLLFSTLEGFGPLIRRSPDLSALQADEATKNVTALGTEIYRQVKPQLPEQPEQADNKKSDKSPK